MTMRGMLFGAVLLFLPLLPQAQTAGDDDISYSLYGGRSCDDGCECMTNNCNEANECTCEEDSHCDDDKCCKEDESCSEHNQASQSESEACSDDCECISDMCLETLDDGPYNKCLCSDDSHCLDSKKCCMPSVKMCSVYDKASRATGLPCFDSCECISDSCVDGFCACPNGKKVCGDPHLMGLRGQKIDWSGVDGGLYCLVRDDQISFQVNVRLTAPLPVEFPDRQLMTAVAILSDGHSLEIGTKNPYTTATDGCPSGISPCLVDGGLYFSVDGQVIEELQTPGRDVDVVDGIEMSAFNLPVECRQFGGDRIWARMHAEFLLGSRELTGETYEEWMLKFGSQASPEWCLKYVAERGLTQVQSNHALFKISTPTVDVSLSTGVGHQGDGEVDFDGSILPELAFWQMDIGFDGLFIDHDSLTGLFGETAHPVLDDAGAEVMEGLDAMRGTVEDYRVSGGLGMSFPLLKKKNV